MQNFLKTVLLACVVLLSCWSIPAGWMTLGVLLLLSRTRSNCRRTRMVFYIFTILVLAWINTTKSIENSDLGYYYWLYNFAGRKTILEYAGLIPREPLYHAYTFAAYYLTGGNFKLFLLLTTALMYLPILAGAEKIMKTAGISGRNILAAGIILLTFSEYFFYTTQLVRQVLAGALAFYIIAQIITSRRRVWFMLLPFCGLIHASAFLFCGYYLIHYLVNNKRKSVFPLISGLLAMLLATPFLASSMAGDASTLSYAAGRLVANSGEKITLGLLPMLVTGSMLPMALWSFKKYPQTEIRQFLGMPLLLLLFMTVNFSNQFIVLRFMEYSYMYLPFVLALFLQPYPAARRMLPLLTLAMIARFLLKLSSSDFSYISTVRLARINVLDFILQFFN